MSGFVLVTMIEDTAYYWLAGSSWTSRGELAHVFATQKEARAALEVEETRRLLQPLAAAPAIMARRPPGKAADGGGAGRAATPAAARPRRPQRAPGAGKGHMGKAGA